MDDRQTWKYIYSVCREMFGYTRGELRTEINDRYIVFNGWGFTVDGVPVSNPLDCAIMIRSPFLVSVSRKER
jgi:hypothetical protein